MPRARRDRRPLIIFDADDTLWSTGPIFEAARQECQRLVAQAGLDPADWRERQIEIDSDLVPTMQFARAQFPSACAQAYRELAQRAGQPVDEPFAQQLYAVADTVAAQKTILREGIEDLLRDLSRTHRLVLLTKGDQEVQSDRVAKSGLQGYFETVVIVGQKSAATFEGICLGLHVKPADAWSVGNSLKSDINTALKAGLKGIWLDGDYGVWSFEDTSHREPGVLLQTPDVRHTVTMIRTWEAAHRAALRRGDRGREIA